MYENLTDDELEDSVFDRYRLMAEKNIENVPEPERTMMVVYGAHGVIENGGFKYFFETDFEAKEPYVLISDSYKNIGLNNHAEAILKILTLFPEGKPHKDLKERNNYLEKYFDVESPHYISEIDEIEESFFEDDEDPCKLCIEYVRKNT